MTGRPSLGLTPDAMHQRRLEQARDCKRRRREARKRLSASLQLCGYGRTKLCLGEAQPSGYCRAHERHLTLTPERP